MAIRKPTRSRSLTRSTAAAFSPKPLPLVLRRALPADVHELAMLERWCHEPAWSAKQLADFYTFRTPSIVLGECDERPIAYAIFESSSTKVCLYRLGVDPIYRRQGYGRQLLESIILGFGQTAVPPRLVIDVRESNFVGQLFLRACGIPCVAIKPDVFVGPPEPAYRFVVRK